MCLSCLRKDCRCNGCRHKHCRYQGCRSQGCRVSAVYVRAIYFRAIYFRAVYFRAINMRAVDVRAVYLTAVDDNVSKKELSTKLLLTQMCPWMCSLLKPVMKGAFFFLFGLPKISASVISYLESSSTSWLFETLGDLIFFSFNKFTKFKFFVEHKTLWDIYRAGLHR